MLPTMFFKRALCMLLTLMSCTVHTLGWNRENNPIVKTNCGRLSGFYDSTDGGFTFRGIPYASPPVNELRWQKPVPLDKSNKNCWKGILDATEYGSECAQKSRTSDRISGNEDCLYLNVWTPTLNTSAKLPVMVYIHGGYLLSLNGHLEQVGYAPNTKLAVETNMVYVSLNYRLNAFGFMALQLLAEKSTTNTSGNYGFMDQIEALKWVQQNIVNFGGDPGQVTVYGHSAGGTSVFALLASPLCQGLFHRAWMISGSPIINKTQEDAFEDNLVFVENTGCRDVDCLYSLSAEQVLRSIPWLVYPYWLKDDFTTLPLKDRFNGALSIVDGYVLQYPPFDAWVKGLGADVPLLIGTTAQETDFSLLPPEVQNWTWVSNDYATHVRASLSPFSDVIAEMALKLYPVNTSTPQYQLASMSTDARVGCGNDYMAQVAASSFKSPVYRYVATYTPTHPVHAYGIPHLAKYAFHGIALFAFMGTLDKLGYNLEARDHRWINNVRQEVMSFVKTGRPSTVSWKTYPEVTAHLSENTTVSCGYHQAECLFWLRNGFFSYSWVN